MKLTALMAAGATLLLTACGSSPSHRASRLPQALEFSQCMRAHGVPNFPDPASNGTLSLGPGLDASSPSFQAAQNHCAKLEPGGGSPPAISASERRRAIRFAQCMRTHGLPQFPDPPSKATAGGPVFTIRGLVFKLGPGLNPRSPAFKDASRACGVTLP